MRRDSELELQGLQPTEEMRQSWRLRPPEPAPPRAQRKLLRCFCLIMVCGFFFGLITVKALHRIHHHHHHTPQLPDNITVALQKSLKFFNAQRSGKLPESNNVSWRGDSGLQDGNSPFPHLVGGFYDDGGSIKSSFTMSFSITMLSWSVIEYSSKFESAGELSHVKELIRWGTDYFLKTFHTSDDTIYGMVSKIGSGDHNCWMRPEDIDYKRVVKLCFASCSHLPAEMAASLASASIVFQDDIVYSEKLLRGAEILYKFAESMDHKDNSDSDSADELLWGATWLYYATGKITYLEKATSPALAKRAGASDYGVFSWDFKLAGTQMLLTRLWLFLSPPYPYAEMLNIYHDQINNVMCSYLPYFTKFHRSKGGLIQLNDEDGQHLQFAANAAFLARLYSDYLNASGVPELKCGPDSYLDHYLRDFSRVQIDYILGKNPQNMSYIVGFGDRYPKKVYHRGASIPMNRKETCSGGWRWERSRTDDPNTIVGAMVAGPDKNDRFEDVRGSYNFTQPSLTGNAGLVAALAAVSDAGTFDVNTCFSGIRSLYANTPPPP